MSEKLGFTTVKNSPKNKLSDEEYESIRDIFKIMETCGSDMTNTLRTLSMISKEPELTDSDKKALDLLISYSVPKENLKNKTKSKYGEKNLDIIRQILNTDPELLRKFGMDPEVARKEIEKADSLLSKKPATVEEGFEKYRPLWQNWIKNYK